MNVFALHGQDTFQVSRSGDSRSKIAVWQRKFAQCGVVGTFVPKARKSTGRGAFLRIANSRSKLKLSLRVSKR
jgi:hypothetical protein